VRARDFFVEVLRQAIHTDFVGVAVLPEVQLREALASLPHEIDLPPPQHHQFFYFTG
jgi:hypothetical protein